MCGKMAFMNSERLTDILEPFPGIRDFIFAPPPSGASRTWIFCATEDPEFILNYHFASLVTHGWRVTQSQPSIEARRGESGLSVSTLRRNDETRIVYEVHAAGPPGEKG
jgi:hypothetical protein